MYGQYGQYGSVYGRFGAYWGVLSNAFSPLDLSPLQYLQGGTEPDEATDLSTNAVNAPLVDSVCGVFDGVTDKVSFGDNWLTQDPQVKLFFCPTAAPSGADRVLDRGSDSGYHLLWSSANVLAFRVYDNGVTIYQVTNPGSMTLNQWYEIDAYYDRANGLGWIRTRPVGGSWTETSAVWPTNITIAGGNTAYLGARNGSLAPTAMKACGLEIRNYATDTTLHRYPMNDGQTGAHHDTVGTAHGTITTGGGGLAAYNAGRQDVFHDAAFNGGSLVMYPTATSSGLSGAPTSTGTKSVTAKFRTNTTDVSLYSIMVSNGKTLSMQKSGSEYIVYYDGAQLQTNVAAGEWVEVTFDADIGATLDLLATAEAPVSLELAYITIADNGGFTASGIYGDFITGGCYNQDQSKFDLTTNNGTTSVFYPALDDGTDDVAGAGIINKPMGTSYVHNGAIYKLQQDAAETQLLVSDLYSADGISFDKVGYQDYLQWVSYSDGVSWLKFVQPSGTKVCHIEGSVITDGAITEAEHGNMEAWKGGASCGNGTSPFSNLDFSDPDNSAMISIILGGI